MDNPDHRLIVYGTLVPGGIYHYLVANLQGTWEKCFIKGHMGVYWGYKSFRYDEAGVGHEAWLFTSPVLPEIFQELDSFEGEGYRRTVIPAQVGERRVLANIYEGKTLINNIA